MVLVGVLERYLNQHVASADKVRGGRKRLDPEILPVVLAAFRSGEGGMRHETNREQGDDLRCRRPPTRTCQAWRSNSIGLHLASPPGFSRELSPVATAVPT